MNIPGFIPTMENALFDTVRNAVGFAESEFGFRIQIEHRNSVISGIDISSKYKRGKVIKMFEFANALSIERKINVPISQAYIVGVIPHTRNFIFNTLFGKNDYRGFHIDEYFNIVSIELKNLHEIIDNIGLNYHRYKDMIHSTFNAETVFFTDVGWDFYGSSYPLHAFMINHEIGHIVCHNLRRYLVFKNLGWTHYFVRVNLICDEFIKNNSLDDGIKEEIIADVLSYRLSVHSIQDTKGVPNYLISIYAAIATLIITDLYQFHIKNCLGIKNISHPSADTRIRALKYVVDKTSSSSTSQGCKESMKVFDRAIDLLGSIKECVK